FDSESALREEPGGHEQEERQPGAEQADPELRGTRWLPLTKADPQPSHHRREHDHHDRLYGLEPGRWNHVAEHVEIRKAIGKQIERGPCLLVSAPEQR